MYQRKGEQTMKKCYLYTRVSTLMQVDGFSLQAQTECLRKYAEYKNLEIVGEYSDKGKSGCTIKGRPDFVRMIDDIVSEKDDISYVLVYKLSRFGRNSVDVLKTLQLLSDYCIDLVAVGDSIDSSTQSGRLTLSILSAVAEIERDNIRAQFTSGIEQKKKSGGWLGGPVPFGYRTKNKELVVCESEAEIVRTIFDRYLETGASMRSVSKSLIDEGYTRIYKGKEKAFSVDFIKGILDQPIYAGFYRHDYRINGNNYNETKGNHKPIITEEIWNKTKEKRALTKKCKKTGNRISVLSGLVKCPVCGQGMQRGDGAEKKNKNHGGYYKTMYYYVCPNRDITRGGSCGFRRNYNQDKVDNAVYEMISRLDVNKDFLQVIKNRMRESDSVSVIKDKERAIRKQIYSLEGQKRNFGKELDAIPVTDVDYYERYDDIQVEIDKIYDKLDSLDEELEILNKKKVLAEKKEQSTKEMIRFIKEFNRVYDKMSRDEKREYYRLFIDKIEVFKDKREDGRIIKSISFKIPIEVDKVTDYVGKEIVPTIDFTIDCQNTEITSSEAKATYPQIKKYILDKYDVKVTSLYIAQVKAKCGLEKRKNYNKSKKNTHVPKCPEYKEEMIVDAFKHFKMLPEDAKIIGVGCKEEKQLQAV